MCWIKLLWQSAKEVWVTPALYLSRGPASIAPAEAARMELHRAPQPWSRVQSCCVLAGALWVFCSYSQLCIRMAKPSGALHGLCQSPGVCWVFGYLQVSQDSLDIARLTLASSYPCWSWRAHPGPAATCSSSPKCIAILAHPYTSPHSDISSSCKTSLSIIKIIFFSWKTCNLYQYDSLSQKLECILCWLPQGKKTSSISDAATGQCYLTGIAADIAVVSISQCHGDYKHGPTSAVPLFQSWFRAA